MAVVPKVLSLMVPSSTQDPPFLTEKDTKKHPETSSQNLSQRPLKTSCVVLTPPRLDESDAVLDTVPRRSMGLPYMPHQARGDVVPGGGLSGAAYMAVPWSVWGRHQH